MLNFLRQFRGLSYSDKFLFLGLVLLVPIVKVCLRFFGFKRVADFFKHLTKTKLERTEANKKIERYNDLLKFFYRFFPLNGMCLPVSLIFWWLLRRQGFETELRFGTRKDNKAKLFAHAWIEYGGVPLEADENVKEKYTAFNESLIKKFD